MRWRRSFLLYALTFAASWRPASAQLLPPILPNIFGSDDRFVGLLERPPYRSVVALVTRSAAGEPRTCTATLVGQRLLLTAAHCVSAQLGADGQTLGIPIFAFAGLTPRSFAARTPVLRVLRIGSWAPENDGWRNDWALLQVGPNWGARFGQLPVRDEIDGQFPLQSEDIWLPGYSGDLARQRTMGVHARCSIQALFPNEGVLHHDCDSTRGASGSPILRCSSPRGCRIVGLHVAERRGGGEESLRLPEGFSSKFANIGVPASEFIQAVRESVP